MSSSSCSTSGSNITGDDAIRKELWHQESLKENAKQAREFVDMSNFPCRYCGSTKRLLLYEPLQARSLDEAANEFYTFENRHEQRY